MTAEDRRWPCINCGADLRYSPGQTSLTCEYCGQVQQITDAPPASRARALGELDLARGLKDDLPGVTMDELRTTSCPSCGALVEFTGATYATECPFCASPLVVDAGLRRAIKPQALVPFRQTEQQARSALTAWMGSLWFAPSGLLDYARKGRALNGVYVPFWTYDAATQSSYSGQRGEYYHETRMVTVTVNGRNEQRQEQIRKIRWYPASGRVARDFDNVLVMASTSLPRRLGDDLTPWDMSGLVPYTADYLAGFQAEAYTVTLAEGHATAREIMAATIAQDVRRDIGGDEQQIGRIDSRYGSETFKHILLPVWMAAYKYNGKSYRFVINGQTGEVQGERPWSIWKIGFAILLVAALIGAGLYLSDPEAMGLPRPTWLN